MGKGLDQIKFAKSQIDITEVIGRFVQLKRSGANYVGISPFSEERTGSFVVNPVKNIFKCFSSGKSGDVIDFLIAFKGFTYKQALVYLAVEQPDELPIYIAPPPLPVSYMDGKLASKTMRGYEVNNFAIWLGSKFSSMSAKPLSDYRVGTSKHWPGACIFWYTDIQGRTRSGKVMGYNPETGKRVKEPVPLITWVHKILRIPDFNLSICLFGEHMLTANPDKPVHIFESEKTAIVASIYYPDWLCLASGSLTNLTYERCRVLDGRVVILHPDCGVESNWEEKRDQLAELIPGDWSCSVLDGPKGYDFCDWIMDNLI